MRRSDATFLSGKMTGFAYTRAAPFWPVKPSGDYQMSDNISGVYDVATEQFLEHEWFYDEDYLDRGLRSLSQGQEDAIRTWINRELFQVAVSAKIRSGRFFNVTWMSPGADWRETPLQYLYSETGEDTEYAACLYGLLVCRIAIERAQGFGEYWFTFKQVIGGDEHTSRSYVLKT